MSKQTYGDESNWKHEPNSEHYVDDKFGKGTETRNWKKNLDQKTDSNSDPKDSSKMANKKVKK